MPIDLAQHDWRWKPALRFLPLSYILCTELNTNKSYFPGMLPALLRYTLYFYERLLGRGYTKELLQA